MVPRVLRRLNRSRRVKRLIDVSVAGGGLLLSAPIVAALTAVVGLRHGWPPIFVQERPGQDGRLFRMYKLRTMTNERDAHGELKPDTERLTELGRFLRASSLDELPELLNVLRGEMSLVGPRPLLTEYLPRYSPRQRRRHDVPPGITGRAQVEGRNALSWNEKFEHDVAYVDDWSNLEDLRILVQTLRTVLLREGIAHEGQATMHKFMGNEAEHA